jgi:exopolysaccharide biosynthesis polyprenyl glycosylphosphotransferase
MEVKHTMSLRDVNPQIDTKMARMLELYTRRQFNTVTSSQRARMLLTLWIIRIKITVHLKRALDVIGASMAIVATSPIMALTALLIRLESPGPILFRQTRVGMYGQTFTCLKFRSMYIDAEQRKSELLAQNEADGPVFKLKRDPRVTRVGRVIRKLSIDELPQFFNVLRGEMSLVGPRPPVPSEVAQYTYDQHRRLHAVPGITGLQQVSGRSNISFQRWVELDLQYIEQQSLWQDIKILLRTIPAVLFGRGAY